MRKVGKTGVILQVTQIVHNDILVEEIQSAHDHLRCKCDTPSENKRKSRT